MLGTERRSRRRCRRSAPRPKGMPVPIDESSPEPDSYVTGCQTHLGPRHRKPHGADASRQSSHPRARLPRAEAAAPAENCFAYVHGVRTALERRPPALHWRLHGGKAPLGQSRGTYRSKRKAAVVCSGSAGGQDRPAVSLWRSLHRNSVVLLPNLGPDVHISCAALAMSYVCYYFPAEHACRLASIPPE